MLVVVLVCGCVVNLRVCDHFLHESASYDVLFLQFNLALDLWIFIHLLLSRLLVQNFEAHQRVGERPLLILELGLSLWRERFDQQIELGSRNFFIADGENNLVRRNGGGRRLGNRRSTWSNGNVCRWSAAGRIGRRLGRETRPSRGKLRETWINAFIHNISTVSAARSRQPVPRQPTLRLSIAEDASPGHRRGSGRAQTLPHPIRR